MSSSSLSESVKFMKDYLDEKAASTQKSLEASRNRSKNQPGNSLVNKIQEEATKATMDAMQSNPIINSGGTIVAQYVNSVAQGLTRDLVYKNNLSPIQNVTQQLFSTFASLTSLGPEIAMEMARNTARNIVKDINARDAVANQLDREFINLYNCCVILLNGSPFFNELLRKVLSAKNYLNNANKKLADVVRILQNIQKYQSRTYDSAVLDVKNARDLLLPDQGVDFNINNLTDLANSITTNQSNARVVAAAANIPLISQRIGTLSTEYIRLTVIINGLLTVFTTSYNDFIEGFKQNNNINQATIDHINSARNQLTTLTTEIQAMLDKNPNNPNDVRYKIDLTANATTWGLRTAAIYEWLLFNPGIGSQVLSQVQDSVNRYLRAVDTINGLNGGPFPGGTLVVEKGQENTDTYLKYTTQVLQSANSILATNKSRFDMRGQTNTVRNYLKAARTNSNAIKATLTPFINSQTTLTGDARKGLQLMIAESNKLGLDRAAGLLKNGDIKSLLALDPGMATSVGAAVAGLNLILSGLKSNAKTTDELLEKVTEVRDQFEREKKTQEIEASRGSSSSAIAEQDQTKAKQARTTQLVDSGIEAADFLQEGVSEDPLGRATTTFGKIIPGFTKNKDIL